MSGRLARPSSDSETPTARPRLPSSPVRHPALTERRSGPGSREEAEAQYVAARNAWTAAMRAAASGRAADMASLAIAQEAYEHAAVERERWLSGARVAIPIEPESTTKGIDAVVGQELAWRRVHEHNGHRTGLFRRLARRLTGR